MEVMLNRSTSLAHAPSGYRRDRRPTVMRAPGLCAYPARSRISPTADASGCESAFALQTSHTWSRTAHSSQRPVSLRKKAPGVWGSQGPGRNFPSDRGKHASIYLSIFRRVFRELCHEAQCCRWRASVNSHPRRRKIGQQIP